MTSKAVGQLPQAAETRTSLPEGAGCIIGAFVGPEGSRTLAGISKAGELPLGSAVKKEAQRKVRLALLTGVAESFSGRAAVCYCCNDWRPVCGMRHHLQTCCPKSSGKVVAMSFCVAQLKSPEEAWRRFRRISAIPDFILAQLQERKFGSERHLLPVLSALQRGREVF